MRGRLIGVVGPSGVGKDSVMQGLAAHDPGFKPVRRVITRAPGLTGEDYDAVTETDFAQLRAAGAFCINWQAHGLFYGIPADVPSRVAAGEQLLVNLSRACLQQVAVMFPDFTVLNITASPAVLAARLSARGRESVEEVAARVSRSVKPLPDGLRIITVANDGPLAETVATAASALQPVRALPCT